MKLCWTASAPVALALLVQVMGATTARAEIEYPYCAGVNGGYGSGFVSCGFTTMAQCRETILGMGGWCQANPYYSARIEPAGDRSFGRAGRPQPGRR